MSRIIYLEGSRAVGKTTLLKNLKVKFPNLIIIDGFARKDFTFDQKKLGDFILNEKLYLNCDIAEYELFKNSNNTVIWVKGPYTDAYYSYNFPRTIKQNWDVENLLSDELNEIKKCVPEEIIYLDASDDVIMERSRNDSNTRSTMNEWMKWLPEFKKYYINDCKAKVITTDNLTADEVLKEFERIVFGNYQGITSKLVERNNLSFSDIKNSGFSFIDYDIRMDYDDQKIQSDIKKIYNSSLNIHQIHLPYVEKNGILTSKDLFENYMNKCKSALKLAVLHNIPYAVIHPVTYEQWMKVDGINNRFEANLHYINQLLPIIESTDVQIAVENLPCNDFSSPEEFKKLFSQINSKSLCMCLDTGHALINNYTYREFYETVGNKIKVFHLNSNNGRGDHHLSIENGLFNKNEFIDLLHLESNSFLSSEIKIPKDSGNSTCIEYINKERKNIEGIYHDYFTCR